jgi:hypothetical protein
MARLPVFPSQDIRPHANIVVGLAKTVPKKGMQLRDVRGVKCQELAGGVYDAEDPPSSGLEYPVAFEPNMKDRTSQTSDAFGFD